MSKSYLKISFIFSLFILSCFSCTYFSKPAPIPIISIAVMDTLDRTKKVGTFTYEDYNGKENISISAKIKRRGGLSYRYDKHSYTLKLATPLGLANLPPEKDWILQASYIDKTFMRHKLAFDLFNAFSPNNIAPKCAYVEVFLNKEYKGLYILMEKLDAKRLRIDKKDSSAVVFKEAKIFHQKKLAAKYIRDANNYYDQRFPNVKKKDKQHEMKQLQQFLFESSDSLFQQKVFTYFDKKNVIDWLLILLFSNNADGVLKNFYLYKQNKHTPYRFALWDYDHSFGRDGDGELNLLERDPNLLRAVLLKRALTTNAANFCQDLQSRWKELQEKNILTKAKVKTLIQQNKAQIAPYIEKNAAIWPYDGAHYYDAADFEAEIILLEKYLDKIPKHLTEQLGKWCSSIKK